MHEYATVDPVSRWGWRWLLVQKKERKPQNNTEQKRVLYMPIERTSTNLAETLERSVDCDVVGLQGHSLMHVCTLKAEAWPACHRSPKQRLAAAPHAIAL
jgi:hypothetical protein